MRESAPQVRPILAAMPPTRCAVPECPYAQRLLAAKKKGDQQAKQKLISSICDKKTRTLCCPRGGGDEGGPSLQDTG